LRYKNQARVATLRGIDSAYTGVTPVDTLVYTGNWFSPERPEVVLGYSVAADLALAARDFSNLIQISAPIPGSNIMAATSPDQVFRSEQVVASGIYEVNDQVNDRFVFCSIETARYLFGWERNQVSSLVIKTASNDLEALKAQISSVFDDKVRVKTRVEQNAALYRMLNSENLFTYLFISLIAAIAVFNLTGTLIMLVLEKKNNLRTLFTLGQPLADIKRTFFASGLLMCGAGLALGLILGVLVVLGQSTFGWVLITETLPYPVTLTWGNFFLVAGTILGLGMLASLLGAQRVTRRLLD
jgi:lipoprotein-releasing system permease protein